MENVYETYEIKPEKNFLFKLFQFTFDYDDEARTCTVSCPISDFMLNPSGIVHGGVLTFIADTAMGHLNFRLKDAPYVTLELKTSFYHAISSGRFIATAFFTKEHRFIFCHNSPHFFA